jgi:hypothetical protein
MRVNKMVINIVLRIDEEQLQEGLKVLGKTREDFRQKTIECLTENVGETIEDNWELFSEVRFTVD